tara:strand:- start:128 stop:637 length:510 start_codon:yes stop_codon:yes gene_type:complete
MKKVIIKGKRNIDGLKGKKTRKRKIIENINNKTLFEEKNQIMWLNKLFLEETFNDIDFVKKEVERKIKSYKNQDVHKNIFNAELFISYNDCLEKLVISKLRCYYCKCKCVFLYEKVLEKKQWTLDRIDNNKGHNNNNVVICCLECNLKKGTINDKKFKFTKQLRIIKTF